MDLLITDLVLPGMNGALLAQQLATLRPAMATLYISGYPGDALYRGEVFDPGSAFLAKPFTRQLLLEKVREMLDTRPAAGGASEPTARACRR